VQRLLWVEGTEPWDCRKGILWLPAETCTGKKSKKGELWNFTMVLMKAEIGSTQDGSVRIGAIVGKRKCQISSYTIPKFCRVILAESGVQGVGSWAFLPLFDSIVSFLILFTGA